MKSRREFLQQTAAAIVLTAFPKISRALEAPPPTSGGGAGMKTYKVPQTDLTVSRLAYGCAGLAGRGKAPTGAENVAKAARLIHTAYDHGVTFFDHADLYGFGQCEEIFGEVLRRSPGLREKIVLQSKCGQRFPDNRKPGSPIQIDLSREHIVSAAEGSLRRLGTDRLDLLLLHVADSLVQPEEVAQAFAHLKTGGKVRYFGVSNYTAAEIELLKTQVREPLVANQVHVGLGFPNLITDGMDFAISRTIPRAFNYAHVAGPGTFDYCRAHEIQIQAYSPLRGELLKPPAEATPEFKKLTQLLADLAEQKKAKPPAIALAWLLRHPAGIVPILGSGDLGHLAEDCAADRVDLSHDEWYGLCAAAAANIKSSD